METKTNLETKVGIIVVLLLMIIISGLVAFDRAHERIINLKIKEIEGVSNEK